MNVVRKLIAEVVADHSWGFLDSKNYHEKFVVEGDPQWRCECGWTTLDHHQGKSKWIDHSDHVADEIVKVLTISRIAGRVIKNATGCQCEDDEYDEDEGMA